MIAGTQSGKTAFSPWWLYREIQRCGNGDYLAVNASYDLFKLKFLPEFLAVFENILNIGRYWAGDKVIELRDPVTSNFWAEKSSDLMWGRVILRSANALGGLESATAKAAILDEPGHPDFTLAAWRAIRRRVSLNQGRILLTTTLYDLGWVKQQIIDLAEDAGRVELTELDNGAEVKHTDSEAADISLIQFDSITNPQFPMEEYRDAQATLPDDEFAMFYRGLAGKLRSLIYDIFSDRHRIRSIGIPAHWPKFVGIDPLGEYIGALWVAFDPDRKVIHVYREYRGEFGATTAGHVKKILALSNMEQILAWVGGGPSERQARLDWQEAGIPLEEPPISEVWSGISRVYALFKNWQLFVHGSCEFLLDEVGSYQRKRDRMGDLTDEIKDKEKYHMLDCLRYIIVFLTAPIEVTQLQYEPVQIGTGW